MILLLNTKCIPFSVGCHFQWEDYELEHLQPEDPFSALLACLLSDIELSYQRFRCRKDCYPGAEMEYLIVERHKLACESVGILRTMNERDLFVLIKQSLSLAGNYKFAYDIPPGVIIRVIREEDMEKPSRTRGCCEIRSRYSRPPVFQETSA